MAIKVYSAKVMRAHINDTGQLLVRLQSTSWPSEQWHSVGAGTPGISSFLAIALTCISTGLPAEVGIDDSLTDFSPLTRIEIVRT